MFFFWYPFWRYFLVFFALFRSILTLFWKPFLASIFDDFWRSEVSGFWKNLSFLGPPFWTYKKVKSINSWCSRALSGTFFRNVQKTPPRAPRLKWEGGYHFNFGALFGAFGHFLIFFELFSSLFSCVHVFLIRFWKWRKCHPCVDRDDILASPPSKKPLKIAASTIQMVSILVWFSMCVGPSFRWPSRSMLTAFLCEWMMMRKIFMYEWMMMIE